MHRFRIRSTTHLLIAHEIKMGCFGALFKKNSEFAPAYAPPTAEVKRDVCEPKQVPASVPKEVEHFEPCGCSDLSSAFARMSAGDADLPAYEEFSEFKDDAVSPLGRTPTIPVS